MRTADMFLFVVGPVFGVMSFIGGAILLASIKGNTLGKCCILLLMILALSGVAFAGVAIPIFCVFCTLLFRVTVLRHSSLDNLTWIDIVAIVITCTILFSALYMTYEYLENAKS